MTLSLGCDQRMKHTIRCIQIQSQNRRCEYSGEQFCKETRFPQKARGVLFFRSEAPGFTKRARLLRAVSGAVRTIFSQNRHCVLFCEDVLFAGSSGLRACPQEELFFGRYFSSSVFRNLFWKFWICPTRHPFGSNMASGEAKCERGSARRRKTYYSS